MKTLLIILGVLFIACVIWAVVSFVTAPEGEEIPGVGFVRK